MIPALAAMLDTTCTVAAISWADPGDGETEKTPSKATRSVQMRIQPIRSRYEQRPEGKRAEATHKGFALASAALAEGEFVGTTDSDYPNYRWEVVHVDPVHGNHQEVEMKRVYDLEAGSDPLA